MQRFQRFQRYFHLFIRLVSAVIFSFIFSGCVSQSGVDFNKRQAAKARVDVALGYLEQSDFTQAKLNLDKAFAYEPDYYLVHAVFAHFYQLQGETQQAEAAYKKALRLDAKQGNVHNNFGTFLCSHGKFEEAYQEFDQALISPNYYAQADTYENIALCALSAGNHDRYEQALEALEKIDVKRAKKLNWVK